jgi:hypothetical protein
LKKFLKDSSLLLLTSNKLDFYYETLHSVEPKNFSIGELEPIIQFKVKSEEVTIIQILKEDVTFKNSENEIKTLTLTDQIKLFSV